MSTHIDAEVRGSAAAVEIAGRRIGAGEPVYIIAEISANHDQSFDQAVQLIQAARDAGADAVKLQTYTPETLTMDSDSAYFQIGSGTPWEGQNLYNLYRQAFTPWEWQPKLKAIANELGLALFSTPYDSSAVDFLEDMGVPAYKIASFEIVDLPLIKRVGSTRKPVIISTGMATFDEIREAVDTALAGGAAGVILLKCNSAYPAPVEEMNLRTIPSMSKAFQVPVGLSDHTLDPSVPVAAAALGACVLEKHITLSRETPGPDRLFSLEPAEFAATVKAVRSTERALGKVSYGPSTHEEASRKFRRSLFVTQNIPRGGSLTKDNVRSIRPADGLPPKYGEQILGRTVLRDVEAGTPLTWDLLSES